MTHCNPQVFPPRKLKSVTYGLKGVKKTRLHIRVGFVSDFHEKFSLGVDHMLKDLVVYTMLGPNQPHIKDRYMFIRYSEVVKY